MGVGRSGNEKRLKLSCVCLVTSRCSSLAVKLLRHTHFWESIRRGANVVEQSFQAFKKISQEHPTPWVRAWNELCGKRIEDAHERFLAEFGALHLLDDENKCIPLEDIYKKDARSEMTEKLFAEYTGIQVKQFRETLLLHMANVKKSVAERTHHKRQYDRRMKERQMQSRGEVCVLSNSMEPSFIYYRMQWDKVR
ncbi:hypothetical protein Tco_1245126 [Tanacetum coccineum]